MFNRVSSTKTNVLANFAGSIWTALLNILLVPVYLRYIGIEAYGLIGILVTLQALMSLLDLGLSPTINREMARLSALGGNGREMHDLKRTLEIPNWFIAFVIAVLLICVSPLIANYWIQPKNLSISTVTEALIIISVNIAIQFSSNFYIGALMGLQRQLFLNFIVIVCGTLRTVGAALVLIYFSSTIQAFLIWQGIILLVQVLLLAITVNSSLPNVLGKGTFQKALLRKIWRFAAGMTGISLVSLALTQLDKVILSRMLSLEAFGYYSLAVTISVTAITIGVSAIAHSVYPRFSQLVLLADKSALGEYYHKSCQIVSVAVLPTVFVLAVFSYDILLAWTANDDIAENSSLILTLLAIGSGLNGLMVLPYYLQLAHGWTKLAFFMNVGSIIVLVPVMIFGIYEYGAIGGAGTWVLLNASSFIITIQLMHRRILKGEQWRWYFQDVAGAAIVNVGIVGISYQIFPSGMSPFFTLFWLAVTWLCGLAISVLSYSNTREMVKNILLKSLYYA